MALPWLRLYTEILEDPKVQMLSENMRWRWVALLCCRRKEEQLTDQTIAYLLRLTPSDVQETKVLFIQHGLIDSNWTVLKWDKRQKSFDSSKKRTQQWRDRLNGDASQQRHKPVTVTSRDAIDTDIDLDVEARTSNDKMIW